MTDLGYVKYCFSSSLSNVQFFGPGLDMRALSTLWLYEDLLGTAHGISIGGTVLNNRRGRGTYLKCLAGMTIEG